MDIFKVPKTSCQFRFVSDSISPYVFVHFVRYLLVLFHLIQNQCRREISDLEFCLIRWSRYKKKKSYRKQKMHFAQVKQNGGCKKEACFYKLEKKSKVVHVFVQRLLFVSH